MFAQMFRQLFNGITQHRAGHNPGESVKESQQPVHAASLANLPEHPARNFMHKVMFVVQKHFSQVERVRISSVTD